MTLNINIVSRAVAGAREQSHDRIQVSLSAFTYAFLCHELLDFQRSDGRVQYLIDQVVPSGTIEVRNVQGDVQGEPRFVDCREKVRHA